MINDTADIVDATVVNIGIEFEVRVEREVSKADIHMQCVNEIIEELEVPKEIGEPFNATDIIRVLKNIDGVVQVKSIKLVNKSGGIYSDEEFDVDGHLSREGTVLSVDENMVLEVKYPFSDIIGSVN